jgi:putative endonuclease
VAGLDPAIDVVLLPRDSRSSTLIVMSGWLYIMTNRRNGTLYVGVTADLARRVWEHRAGVAGGFTRRYGLKLFVYVERHEDILTAKQRELNMKRRSRAWKVRLIHHDNLHWVDLYDRLL